MGAVSRGLIMDAFAMNTAKGGMSKGRQRSRNRINREAVVTETHRPEDAQRGRRNTNVWESLEISYVWLRGSVATLCPGRDEGRHRPICS